MAALMPLPAAVPPRLTFQRGFTLMELAMVMFIFALLLGGMILPLSAQNELRRQAETQKTLSDARDALIGFAMINGRLPCPASSTSNGRESFCSNQSGACTATTNRDSPGAADHGRCSNPHDGFFPAASLGFTPVDSQGYAIDGWGEDTVNRLRYAITDVSYTPTATTAYCQPSGGTGTTAFFPFTCPSGMKEIFSAVSSSDLRICNGGANVTNVGTTTADCSAGNALATDAVAIVYSVGKTGGSAGAGTDENHNPNPKSTLTADRAFVDAPQSASFDDSLVWISKSALFGRLVTAGKLP